MADDDRGLGGRVRPLGWGILLTALGVVYRARLPVWGWQVRLLAARLLSRVPPTVLPRPLRVLPPPESEYVGVWELPASEARRRLLTQYDFSQLARAYLHAYGRDGRTAYEAVSCARRPGGLFGDWQLHVRLFARPDGRTDVWCHVERNPNVAPIAHLRRDGYDPERGERRLRELVDEPFVEPEDA